MAAVPTAKTGGTPAAKPVLSMTQRVQARAAKDPAFAARAQANPGLRSMLKAGLLTPGQAQQRALNLRLNAPVTPGSSMTNRDLSHQAANAVKVQYGPADQQASQLEQQVPAYFKNYLADLQAHQAATKAANDAAVTQDQQLLAGVRGLDQASSTQMQQAANADAANRGTTAGDTTQTASDASQVRQAMLAALGSAQAGRGAAANTYASTLANVVGPGQQLGAQTAAGQKLLGIRGQEGAANQAFRADTIASEAKNVLAQQIAGGNQAAKAGTLKLGAAKLTAQQKRDAQQAKIAEDRIQAQQNSPAAQKTAQQVAFFNQHGYYPASGGPKAGTTPRPRTGPGSLSPQAESKVVGQIQKAQNLIQDASKNHSLTDAQIQHFLVTGLNPGKVSFPKAVVQAALDLERKKGLTPASVRAVHNDLNIHVGGHFPVLKSVKVKAHVKHVQGAPAPPRVVVPNLLGPAGTP